MKIKANLTGGPPDPGGPKTPGGPGGPCKEKAQGVKNKLESVSR